jgi:DNA-binding IclR family transcriptional regulator
MVYEIHGLNATDTDILRFLAGHTFEHFEAGPTLISDHTGAGPSTVHRRLDRLQYAGLVEESTTHSKSGRYLVTELGRRFLAENLDTEELMQLRGDVEEYIDQDG